MTVLFISSILLLIIYSLLILYYRAGWKSIVDIKPINITDQPTTKISVIISARNEEKNLTALLASLSAQRYPADLFEVLVIDDHSTDNTAAIIESCINENVKLISLHEHITGNINSYKKKAIEIGVQQSNGKLIVTTDADCIVPKNWLLTIASCYEKSKPAFIAAPVSINCSNSFIEIFQALDFMTLQGITGAAVQKKIHSMCNGANLAYEKKAFEDVGGFSGIDNIASGDDMLLMHKIYKRYPQRIMFLKSGDAIVQTAPVKTISAFFNQRIRWASKADKYDDKRIMPVLFIVYLLNVMFLVLPVVSIFSSTVFSINNYQITVLQLWLALLFVKIIIELFFLYPIATFFGKKYLLWIFPVMQPFHILYTVIAGWLGKFGSYQWKERKVK